MLLRIINICLLDTGNFIVAFSILFSLDDHLAVYIHNETSKCSI